MNTSTKVTLVAVGLGILCLAEGYLISGLFFFGAAYLAKKFMLK